MAQLRYLQQAVVLFLVVSTNVYGMRVPVQQLTARSPDGAMSSTSVAIGCSHSHSLNTYFLSASDVHIDTSASSGRKGTTRLTVQLQEQQVSRVMPVVTATPQGVLHNAAHTWSFLKSYALQSKLVNAMNKQTNFKPHLYAVPAVALETASALATATSTISKPLERVVERAEASNPRDRWTHTAPTNVLLLTSGHPVGAVADIMAVELTDTPTWSAPTITLTLDVVHTPHIINELQKHGKQTLDDHAHYHFFTPAGVTIDAQAFLALLASSGGTIKGLHMFAKGECGGIGAGLELCPVEQVDAPCRTEQAECRGPANCTTYPSTLGNGNILCCPTNPAASGTPCTDAATGCPGSCDGGRSCVVTDTSCSSQPAGTVCRAATPGTCERDATCLGGSVVCCPVNLPAFADTACTGAEGCAGTCNGVDTTCTCPPCTTGTVCRPAAGHCDTPEVCTNGVCPADTFKHDGARCPWFPQSHGRHGPYSVDVSSSRAVKVSAAEAAARLSAAPSYLREWPSCEGTCINGRCALCWDHPACCGIHRATHYEFDEEEETATDGIAAQTTALGRGHWEGPEYYCWD